jgi:hypothetical protein
MRDPDPTPSDEPAAQRDAAYGPAGIVRLVKDFLALDRRALAILVTVPISMTLLEYFGLPWHYTRWSQRMPRVTAAPPPHGTAWMFGVRLPGPPGLQPYLWWGLSCIVLMVILPMIVGAFAGASPRQLGVRIRGTGRDAWTYLVLFLVFIPVVWLVSHGSEFIKTYPFYKPWQQVRPGHWDGRLDAAFFVFEAVYCLQFFAIEFFFRGFIVLGLKPRLGMASVLVMLAPYCMIHYYKPFPEAMGAIGAGLILGLLSWRTGTILYGWFLHYSVALTMDLLGLQRAWSALGHPGS